jgi:hypothetical protein
MLADSLTLGTAGDALVYKKLWGDESGTLFAVQGLSVDQASTLRVKYATDKSGTTRALVDLSTNVPVSGSTTGAYRTRRLYFNIVRNSSDTAAAVKSDFVRAKTIVDSTAIQDQLLNLER